MGSPEGLTEAAPWFPSRWATLEVPGMDNMFLVQLRSKPACWRSVRHARRWVQRLEAAHVAALEFVNEQTYRVWRLYMAGSARGFAQGRLAVYQTLLVKPAELGRVTLPLTRNDWYCP